MKQKKRMGAGLIFTPVSVYQMTRSALVLWVGLFSVLFLGRRLSRVEVVSLFTVCFGVFIVGLSSASNAPGALPAADAGKVLLGVSLILFAQILWVCFSDIQRPALINQLKHCRTIRH